MKNQILKKIYRAVVYLRLSDEDGDNRESDSISNQRILIHSFLKSHPEIQVVKECVDDGYTGTNFSYRTPIFSKVVIATFHANIVRIVLVKPSID